MIEEMTQDRNTEIETPDTFISDVANEVSGTMEEAFDILINRRDAGYAAEIAPLDAERAALVEEHEAIGEAAHNLELLLPAKARIAQNEADQLTVGGKSEEAKAKLEEMRQAENAPEAMKQRQREISARIEAIESERKVIARRIFQDWYADVQQVIRAAEHGLFVTLLNGIENSMIDFQTRTGTTSPNGLTGGLFHSGHITGLTANDRSPEWRAASRWYGGRGRR